MDDTIPIPLKVGAPFRGRFWVHAAARLRAKLGVRGKELPFALLQILAGTQHRSINQSESNTPTEMEVDKVLRGKQFLDRNAP